MATIESSGEHARLRRVLETWFLAQEEGRRIDLEALCGGDTRLLADARALLDVEPSGLGPAAAEPVDPTRDDPVRLGEFAIERRLGRGGMGTVYLARQESLGRTVALKVLSSDQLGDPNARLRFQREAELTAALDHPGIVPIYGVGSEGDQAFIAMKRLAGPSLAALDERPPPRRVAEWGASIARALDAAHVAGVVHRDVKPGNVLLDDGRPVLVDFGLARSTVDRTLTRANTVPGTLPYMAPEQLQQRRPLLDPRLDVYSLGATLYELLAGEPPFVHERTEELLRKILLDDPAPLRPHRADRDLETIVLEALDKEPRRRYATALAMAEDLERYLAGDPILARPSRVFSRYVKLARRHRRTTLGVGTLAAVLLVVTIAWLGDRTRSARALSDGLAAASAALAEDEPRAALEALDQVAALGSGDAEYESLRQRVVEWNELEALFDVVIDRGERLEIDRLRVCLDAVRRHGARPRIATLLECVALVHLRKDTEAVELLSGVAEGPGPRAIAALLDGRSDWPDPGGDDVASADEWILASYVCFLGGAPTPIQRSLLDRALDLEPGNARAALLRAQGLAAEGRFAEAESTLASLRRRAETSRKAWRITAQCRLGRWDVAGCLAGLHRIPRSEWNANEHFLAFGAYHRREDAEGVAQSIEALRRIAGAGAFRNRVEADVLAFTKGDMPGAIAQLEHQLENDLDRIDRELALASILEFSALHVIRIAEAPGPLLTRASRWADFARRWPGRIARASVRHRGLQLLESLRLSEPRATVLQALGRVEQSAWNLSGLLSNYDRSIAHAPGDSAVRLEFVLFLWSHFDRGWSDETESLLASYLREHADVLWAKIERGDLSLDSDRIDRLVLASAEASMRLPDERWRREALVRQLDRAADSPLALGAESAIPSEVATRRLQELARILVEHGRVLPVLRDGLGVADLARSVNDAGLLDPYIALELLFELEELRDRSGELARLHEALSDILDA